MPAELPPHPPAGWTRTQLGSLGAWSSGGTPSKARADYWLGTIPWVSPKDMKRFVLDDVEDHVSEAATITGTRLVPSGSVFIVVRGMILAHTFPVCVAARPMAFNQDVKAIVPNGTADGRFVAHWLSGRSDALLRLVTEATHGTKRLEQAELKAFGLDLPPPVEQRQIAAILDTIDGAIRKTEQILAKLKQVKQGLLHDLLTRGIDDNGELREPERHPAQFKDSPLGRIPRAWDATAFGQLCGSSAFGPRFPGTLYASDGGLATLRTTDMDDDGNIELATMPRAAIQPSAFASHLLREHDLLISRSGTCGIAAVFPGYALPVVPGAFLIRFRLLDWQAAAFYRHYFNSEVGRPYLERLAVGGVQKNIKGSDILALTVPSPSSTEAREIVRVLQGHMAQAARETARLSKLRLLKAGLTEDLLTGRVRVANRQPEGAR